MARNPGYLVHFTDKEGKCQYGRTFHSESTINGKIVVFYMTDNFHQINEIDKYGKQVWKKRLIDNNRLTICGMCD